MIEKKIVTSGKVEALNPNAIKVEEFTFPVGTKFYMNDRQYTVKKSYVDGAIEFRLLFSDNNEEVYMLSSLRRDASLDTNFKVFHD